MAIFIMTVHLYFCDVNVSLLVAALNSLQKLKLEWKEIDKKLAATASQA
jgi:hypothetical protein